MARVELRCSRLHVKKIDSPQIYIWRSLATQGTEPRRSGKRHMKQENIKSLSDLLAKAGVIKVGVTTYEASIPLLLNTSAAFGADLDALIAARDNHEQARLTLPEKFALVDSIMETGRNSLTMGRDVLKPVLGYEYSDKYAAIGLNQGSAALPRTIDGVQSTLGAFKGFFDANPTLEQASLNVTAAHYQSLYNQLLVARGQVNQQKKTIEDLMAERDAKEENLRKRIRWLISELEQRIDPLSSIWTAMGLNKPGANETPDMPEGVTVTLIGPTAAAVKWSQSPRAEYYRVYTKPHGGDGDYTLVGSPADLDFTIENLPTNSQIDVVVVAVNNGGASAQSEPVTITTQA